MRKVEIAVFGMFTDALALSSSVLLNSTFSPSKYLHSWQLFPQHTYQACFCASVGKTCKNKDMNCKNNTDKYTTQQIWKDE